MLSPLSFHLSFRTYVHISTPLVGLKTRVSLIFSKIYQLYFAWNEPKWKFFWYINLTRNLWLHSSSQISVFFNQQYLQNWSVDDHEEFWDANRYPEKRNEALVLDGYVQAYLCMPKYGRNPKSCPRDHSFSTYAKFFEKLKKFLRTY